MKLDDFSLLEGGAGRDQLIEQLARFNAVPRRYPRESVANLFTSQARRTPDACAARQDDRTITYAELERDSNRVAHLLRRHGVASGVFVGVMLDDAVGLATALLGILKAGGAYAPLDSDAPYERTRFVLQDTGARVLIAGKTQIRTVNRLQWDCPSLAAVLCIDSDAVDREPEALGEKMRQEVWDYVGQTMFDDISGGGWQSSFTGEWLSREVMDDYGDNALHKLAPLVDARSRVLEVGCASGITMFRLAPRVGAYVGTDLSPEILSRSRQEAERRQAGNIALHALPAHDIDRLADRDFDVVVINSVLQCFSGHNYLKDVLRKAIALLGDRGVIFLGNVFDQDLKDEFVAALRAFRKANPAARTKTDYSEELFINRAFLDDLRHDFPEVRGFECSPLIGTHESELSKFSFDAILHIDKTEAGSPSAAIRHKHQLDRGDLERQSDAPLGDGPAADSLAYAIYTSGTSGVPKGVLVDHLAIVRLVMAPSFATLNSNTRLLMTGALAFDASTFEVWGPLLNGGTLHRSPRLSLLDPVEIAGRIREWGITTMWLTASLFNQFVDDSPAMFAGLTELLIGGERLSPPHVAAVRKAHPGLTVINGYGPTENTTFTACCRITRDYEGDIPIGRPISGTEVLILDGQGEPVPIDVPGEICASGDGLARGYLNDAALTAQKFPAHPWAAGRRIYKTGDRGRWTRDGEIQFLGRLDDQLKIRGYRIEPAEIEHRIRECAGVRDACVVAVDGDSGAPRELAAYVAGEVDAAALRADLKDRLPDYMIPAYLIPLERLPLTMNGKVDRRALPRPSRTGGGVAAASDTERELAKIWAEVLGTADVGVTDNFFDLGGHSLKVTKLVALIQQRLGVRAPLAAVFRSPTVRDLAKYLLDAAEYGISLADDAMVVLGGSAGAPPLFALPPGTGDVMGYMPLADQLRDWRLHAFNFIEAPTRFDDYAGLIAGVHDGPVVLFGYSSGGNLAFHTAAAIERRGGRVSDIIMVDSGRNVAPYPFMEDSVLAAAHEFLEHETIKPYCNTPVLRDKVIRKIVGLYRFLSATADDHVIHANIHVILADDHELEHVHEGRVCSSIPAWAQATTGRLQTYQGAGPHNHMLYEPWLAQNLRLLETILRGVNA